MTRPLSPTLQLASVLKTQRQNLRQGAIWVGVDPLDRGLSLQDLAASDVEDGAVKASAIAMARRLLDSTD